MKIWRQTWLVTVTALLCALPACRVTDWRIWNRGTEPVGFEVQTVRDITYCDGAKSDAHRHRLDLYLPKGKKDFPVVFLVHGGAWMLGDNRCCGLYASVGEFLASQGIGVVMPNYRLSPSVKHPEHIKDVARAFAWTKNHIAEHGGRPDEIVLVGHSAGGHLVALLTTDEQYLKAEGCRVDDIRGVVCISGVFRIPDGKVDVFLGGATPLSLRLDEMLPLRGTTSEERESYRRGLPVGLNIASVVFGDDPQVRLHASPTHHVRPGLPPFLFLNAQKDLPILPSMAAEMHRQLTVHGCESRHITIDNTNHNSIVFNAITTNDPVAREIVQFVRTHAAR